MNHIGARIRKLRMSCGMTQGELGERLNIKPSTVGMYERGCRRPDGEMLVKICEVFHVSSDSLLGMNDTACEAIDIIKEMSNRIRWNRGIMLNGAPMSDKDREKLLNAIEVATQVMLSQRGNAENGDN